MKKKKAVRVQPGSKTVAPRVPPSHTHRGEPVRVGPYQVHAGGTRYLQPKDFEGIDIVIPLEPRLVAGVGQDLRVLACPWRDYGPPPDGFEQLLRAQVIPALAEGQRLLVYCIGSHGRTGTFLASLIALTENSEETPDPIRAVRERHCHRAVETLEQAQFVFGLRGQALPVHYRQEFAPKPKTHGLGVAGPIRFGGGFGKLK